MPDSAVVANDADIKSEPTLTESIETAAKTEQPKAEEPKVETKAEDETKEDEKPSDGLTDEERQHAINLFNLLKNKDTAAETIKILASQAGIIKTEAKAEATAKSIVDLLREELGEEYAFMADKLAPAIEKATSRLVEDKTKDITAKFEAAEEAKVKDEVDKGITHLEETFDDAKEYFEDIFKLMDEYPPSSKVKASKYFEDLYSLAKARKAGESKSNKLREKIERNRNDAPSRLASGGKGTTVKGEAAPKEMNITESIKKAMEEITVT